MDGVTVEDCSPAVERLVCAVAALQLQTAADLPAAVALADVRQVLRQVELLRTVALGRLADLERRELYTLDGASSAAAWVRSQPVSAGRGDIALARRLSHMKHVEAAVLSGRLDLAAAGQVGAALDKASRHVDRRDGRINGSDGDAVVTNVVVHGVLQLVCEGAGGLADDDPALKTLVDELVEIAGQQVPQLERLEQAMVVLATRLPRTMLAAGLDRLLDALTPEELEHRVETAHARRGFTMVRNADGSGYTVTRGHLSLELGEYLEAVLAAVRSTDPANPQDTEARRQEHRDSEASDPVAGAPTPGAEEAPGEAGDDAGEDEDGAAAADDGAEAEEALPGDTTGADRALGPRTRAQRDHDALLLALRRLLDSGALGLRGKVAPHIAVTVDVHAASGEPGALPAMSATGARLPASLVRKLLCDSRLTRVVLSLGRRVLEVSHTERTAKPHERLALAVQWGDRCAESGCCCPQGTPLIPHHVEPYSKTGTTAVGDSVPVCPLTHDHIHVRGRTITLRDGRRIGPNGWVRGLGDGTGPSGSGDDAPPEALAS